MARSSTSFKVDYTELTALRERLGDRKLLEKAEKDMLLKAANSFIKLVQRNTPVSGEVNPYTGRSWDWVRKPDHPKGRLRDAWLKDNPKLEAKVVRRADGYEITIVNNTNYASWVENGHRKFIYGRDTGEWTMGCFFVRRSEISFENGELPKIVANRIYQWVEEVVNGK